MLNHSNLLLTFDQAMIHLLEFDFKSGIRPLLVLIVL